MPNDHDQFTHHFHELYPKLCRFLEGLVGKSACAHDLAQETMLRLFQHSDPIPAEEVRFWVFRVARNLALNELEHQRTRSKLSGWVVSLFGSSRRTPETELAQKEQTNLVFSLIGRLPDHQRAAILLREQEEMSYSEIATVLGVTEIEPSLPTATRLRTGILPVPDNRFRACWKQTALIGTAA